MTQRVTSASVVTTNINGSNYLVKLSQIGLHTTQIKLHIELPSETMQSRLQGQTDLA